MSIFFVSDMHFHHNNIPKFCPDRIARWPDIVTPSAPGQQLDEGVAKYDMEAMAEGLIQRWNAVVQPTDTVYNLGDMFFCNADKALQIMKRLNGHQHLIYGNHDKTIQDNKELQATFASIRDYREVKINKKTLVLFHFPLLIWNKGHHGSWHLHGHCHDSLTGSQHQNTTRADIGVDSTQITGQAEHRPFSYEEIEAYMHTRTYQILDHHDGTRQ